MDKSPLSWCKLGLGACDGRFSMTRQEQVCLLLPEALLTTTAASLFFLASCQLSLWFPFSGWNQVVAVFGHMMVWGSPRGRGGGFVSVEMSPVLSPCPRHSSHCFLMIQWVLDLERDGIHAAQLTAAMAGLQGIC